MYALRDIGRLRAPISNFAEAIALISPVLSLIQQCL
jgi:hypothetical protein